MQTSQKNVRFLVLILCKVLDPLALPYLISQCDKSTGVLGLQVLFKITKFGFKNNGGYNNTRFSARGEQG